MSARAPTSRSAAAATGRSMRARRNSACRSASTSAAMAGTRRPAAAGRPITSRSTSRNAHTMAAQLTSLVLEGIPERFPKLKIVFIEGGFGWIPSATWRMDRHFEALPQRGAASQAPAVGICEGAFLVHDAADRRAGRGKASALADRVGRRRSPAVLVGLSALGFRRSALRLQDAADGSRAAQDLQRQRARASTSSDRQGHMARHIVARTIGHPARRQQGLRRRRPRHRRVPRQRRVLRAAQSLPA